LTFVTDLAVGGIDSVVVLRSRPVHKVSASIQFASEAIVWQKTDSCLGLIDLDQISNAAVDRRQQQQQQQQGADAAKCGGRDIVISGRELIDRLDSDATFCLVTTLAFNYSTPPGDPLRNVNGRRS
jgi:hypothetical protein